jgi:uncharacterized coiled-coil DUF342 family protein
MDDQGSSLALDLVRLILELEQSIQATLRDIDVRNETIRNLERELASLVDGQGNFVGTPEYRELKSWWDALAREECTLSQECILGHLERLRLELHNAETNLFGVLVGNNQEIADLTAQYNDIEDKASAEAMAIMNQIADIRRSIRRTIHFRTREIRREIREWERELRKFMHEIDRVNEEIAEREAEVEALEEEFEAWKEFCPEVAETGSHTASCPSFELDEFGEPPAWIMRFGNMSPHFCYFLAYTRTINRFKLKIKELEEYIIGAQQAKVLRPYIWQFNTYMWKNMIQEGMAYYRLPAFDEIDPDIDMKFRPQRGWGNGRGINHRTNWDFSWARGWSDAGAMMGRHGVQTSRKSISGSRCLMHYVDRGLLDQNDSTDSQIAQIERRIEEITSHLQTLQPGNPLISVLTAERIRLFNEIGDIRAYPEDHIYKVGRDWEQRLIPLSDYRPYGIVGRTLLNTRGGAAPIPPMITTNEEPEISDWRKGNDVQIKDMYDQELVWVSSRGTNESGEEVETGNFVTKYIPKDGTNLLYNLIDPSKIKGYNLVRDNRFKWQRKRFRQTQSGFEEFWEDDPDMLHINEFLVWYDGTSFIQKPYDPDSRLGGLLYKMDSHKYMPTLSQRSPINALNTNIEKFTIHNAYFVNRRQAFGAIECHEGLLTVTFFNNNFPITNPAPRGQVPFWYGEIQFAPDTMDLNGNWVQHRDIFIARKGGSGWICREDRADPLVDEIRDFHSFWWWGGTYYIKNHYGVGRLIPMLDHDEDGNIIETVTISWLRETPWRTHLGKIWNDRAEQWDDPPWDNPIRATVFTGSGAVVGRTNTSGSAWMIKSAIPNTLEAKEVYPISNLESFNDRLEILELRYLELYEHFEEIWWQHVAGLYTEQEILDLWEEVMDMSEQIRRIRAASDEVSPLLFFNMLRPNLQRELKDLSDRIVELEDELAKAEAEAMTDTARFADVVRIRRTIENLKERMIGSNQYNVCLMIRDLFPHDRFTHLINGIHYIVLEEHDKIKKLQLIGTYIYLLTEKGRLFRGNMPLGGSNTDGIFTIDSQRFAMKECTLFGINNRRANYGPILDFWMEIEIDEEGEAQVAGRLVYSDMYETGFTVRITQVEERAMEIVHRAEEQRMDKSIEDEPYGGTTCQVMLFDSAYNNPTALVNYKGAIWLLRNGGWKYTGKVRDDMMTASFTMEFNLRAECDDANDIWELSPQGMLMQQCGFEDDRDQDLDPEDFPPRNLNYNSVVGDGTLKPSDFIGADRVADLDRIITIIRTAGTYGELAEVKGLARFGQNSQFFDNILRGLALTPSSLRFEYIESIRDLLLIEIVYNRYFYVKSTRSLWEYNGKAWMEFLKFTNGFPVKDSQEYIEMKCFLDSTGCPGVTENITCPLEPLDDDEDCCRRCEEERGIIEALCAIANNTLITTNLTRINAILGTSFYYDEEEHGVDNIAMMVNHIRGILGDPSSTFYPSSQQQADEVNRLLIGIMEFIRQGSVDLRQTRYLLAFTVNLVREEMIPLFGELTEFIKLIGEAERYKARTLIRFSRAVEIYNEAYQIAESCISSIMFDMSMGDFFVEPDPCKDLPQCEDECDCHCKYGQIFHLNIENIFHKPRLDIRNSRMLNFVSSLERDFIAHADLWSTDRGHSWTQWNDCIGPCSGCRANPQDSTNISLAPRLIIDGTRDENEHLWSGGLWVFVHIITDGARSLFSDRHHLRSTNEEWLYDIWTIQVRKEWYDMRLAEIAMIEDENLRALELAYFMNGVDYLMRLGGPLIKEVRNVLGQPIAPPLFGREYSIRLDPPPNMIRDNTDLRFELNNELLILNRQIQEVENTISSGVTTETLIARWQELNSRKTAVQLFLDARPASELYSDTYQFDIVLRA